MKIQLVKALALLIALVFVVHFYMLWQTGHIDPCDAAYAKLEFEHLNDFKNKRRELAVDEEQQELYESINKRDIAKCYKIVLF